MSRNKPSTIGGSRQMTLVLGAVLLWLSAWPPLAGAEFTIRDASVRLQQQVYQVDALLNFQIDGKPHEALENGVPLVLELELRISHQREYLWDETIATVHLRHRLEYRALSRRYQLENLNTGEQESFPSLNATLEYLNKINDFPLIDRSLLQPGQQYQVALRTRLDIEALPTPLRALAYVTPGWYLSSDWYSLPLSP